MKIALCVLIMMLYAPGVAPTGPLVRSFDLGRTGDSISWPAGHTDLQRFA
jgi:hypothetical protein